jgi:hypothetical protein
VQNCGQNDVQNGVQNGVHIWVKESSLISEIVTHFCVICDSHYVRTKNESYVFFL